MTGLPLIYLDQLWHKKDRTTVTREEFDDSLRQVLAGDSWIIDGNYGRTLEFRLQHCDTVFFLDYPLEICLEGAASRIGTIREDLPWVEEEFDPEFRQWILDFPKDQRPLICELLDRYSSDVNVITFHSREDASDWLQNEKLKN
jgi:adenylate kinase family enzyme